MPLSEQEQRLLEEMERSLYQNDADFVATVGSHGARPNYKSLVLGILIGVAGVATLVTGVIVQLAIVGIVGFAIMFTGALVALTPRRPGSHSKPSKPSGAKRGGPNFMDSLGERWERRQDGRDV